jgi:hypothetical protein
VWAVLLAHQGGWDETLLVLAPVALVAGLLHVANRRAKQHLAAHGQVTGQDAHGEHADGGAGPEVGSTVGDDEVVGRSGPGPIVVEPAQPDQADQADQADLDGSASDSG